jgi:plastocyanin
MRAKTWSGALLLAAVVAVAAAAVVTRAGAREEVREIRLVARGMAFFLEGDTATANPTLRVKAGERVRIVVSNETAGMEHDLAIASLGAAIDPLATGATATLDLQVPGAAGTHEYECRPHAVMMRGRILVEAGL